MVSSLSTLVSCCLAANNRRCLRSNLPLPRPMGTGALSHQTKPSSPLSSFQDLEGGSLFQMLVGRVPRRTAPPGIRAPLLSLSEVV